MFFRSWEVGGGRWEVEDGDEEEDSCFEKAWSPFQVRSSISGVGNEAKWGSSGCYSALKDAISGSGMTSKRALRDALHHYRMRFRGAEMTPNGAVWDAMHHCRMRFQGSEMTQTGLFRTLLTITGCDFRGRE